MINLTHMIQNVINMYSVPVVVLDMVYEKVSGFDRESEPTERTIQAAVDPSSTQQLEMIFGGSVARGSIGIYTTDQLYITDETDEGVEKKQSYIDYNGIRYRAMDLADWTTQLGVRVYLAERHVTQDKV